MTSERLQALTRINLDDLMGAFGWKPTTASARLACAIFHVPARAFARQMLTLDDNTGKHGLVIAARAAERLQVQDVRVHGLDRLPAGGFLALANHPGLTDTLALFAALGRTDLRVIALHRPFLVTLVNISRQLLYLQESANERVALVREVGRHLRNGGAVLTFPAGRNEPDPQAYRGAVAALAGWTPSAEVFVRLAPGSPIVPVCVRGVTWTKAANHPLTRLRRLQEDRQLLASALQLLWQSAVGRPPITVHVQIGQPIYAARGGVNGFSSIHEAVLREMRVLIENPPAGAGQSVLWGKLQ
jgi:1-acyl-sn-glycerol-3-phosphate acyltransferase